MKRLRILSSISKKKIWLLLFLGIVVAICVALMVIRINRIPSWVIWTEKEIEVGTNKVILHGKKLEVRNSEGEVTFTADKSFKIQDVLVTDIDRDNEPEMIVLLWKRGIYGKHRPFWIKSDEKNYSQHIFLFDLNADGTAAHKWGASETGIDVNRMKIMEKNDAILLVESIDGKSTLWTWDSWGLKILDSEIKFVAFGDNLIHAPIYEYARAKEGGKFDFLYKPFLEDIQDADMAALNAETVLVDKDNMVGGYPSFGSPMEVGDAIAKAGFDVVSCANNHVLDRGVQGIDLSYSFYKENGITCVGIQSSTDTEYRPYEVISKNGMKIALLSYTYGTNMGDISEKRPNMIHYLPRDIGDIEDGADITDTDNLSEDEKKLLNDLKEARKEADFVIVFAHWGQEYQKETDSFQERMARIFALGGADVVIGSHPHVVQKTEMLDRPDGGKMLVYYSLGNFRADQGRREETRTGLEAVFTIGHVYDGVKLIDYSQKEIDAYWR